MTSVLIVDDEKHIREDLGKHLRKKKYEVYTASTVEEAKKIISHKELDYAIIDLKLDFTSEFSGIKVFVFNQNNKPNIKSIALSAYPFKDVKEQLKKEVEEKGEPETILKKIEYNYIHKGGIQNYIIAILNKLEEFGQKKEEKNSSKLNVSAGEDTNE
jgi:DNA-binding NtrC family response regulator